MAYSYFFLILILYQVDSVADDVVHVVVEVIVDVFVIVLQWYGIDMLLVNNNF